MLMEGNDGADADNVYLVGPQGPTGLTGPTGTGSGGGGGGSTGGGLTGPTGGIATTTPIMVGLGLLAGFHFTPTVSGNLVVYIDGISKNTTLSDGVIVQLYQGTGTAPSAGAAVTGTRVATSKSMSNNASASSVNGIPFAITGRVTGLTLGVAVWFDLSYAALLGGVSTLFNIDVTIVETG